MSELRISHSIWFVAGILLAVSSFGRGQQSPAQKAEVSTLELGQFLSAVVEQKGIDVIVTAIGPDGNRIADVDSPNGEQGPEPVKVTAKVAGAYRFEIRSFEPGARRGSYSVEIAELLTAGQNQERIALQQAQVDGVKKWLQMHRDGCC